jgi:hypothetical protein
MMFSWEKQKTPSRPPLMVVSMMMPVSATICVPSKKRTLFETRRTFVSADSQTDDKGLMDNRYHPEDVTALSIHPSYPDYGQGRVAE